MKAALPRLNLAFRIVSFSALGIALLLFVPDLHAAPVLTSVTGTFSNGNTVTAHGSQFGTKSPVAPWLWRDFEEGSQNQLIQAGSPAINVSNLCANDTNPARLAHYGNDSGRFTGDQFVVSPFGPTGGCPSYNYGSGPYNVDWTASGLSIEAGFPDTGKSYFYGWVWSQAFNTAHMEQLKLLMHENYSWPQTRIEIQPFASSAAYPTIIPSCSSSAASYGGNAGNVYISVLFHNPNWTSLEVIEDYSVDGGAGYFGLKTNSQLVAEFNGVTTNCAGEGRHRDVWKLTHFGRELESNPTPYPHGEHRWGELYIDTSWARILLCNNQNYSQATHCEIQIPLSGWDGGSTITFRVNSGSMMGAGTQAYLFVFDSSGQRNSSGFPVNFNGIPTPTPDSRTPAAPQDLRVAG